ncbi:MAG: 50S ribosomal protein L4 [Gemmatimonadales bacterium]|nr:50S ribosomal protein L4 [Gemmatimonadales bacterium]NIN12764.1 50S ribosomal protein L4 [Gemmatimonadales bacterium]NIN50988.1 50S ribosomal protein L4 [Gemmatimonadales bacterium]NIP08452.1 50S ribosomal protein L4 [Gemmatimonadales bacterium]NIR02172.1 50S ribosomal protein L4 [Gemmatimonadales bacterium]
MLEAQLYTAAAKKKGTYALPREFDGTVNQAVLYDAVRAFRGNQRRGTHSTKTRSEVSGGGRKPWRQKGTGRARQGTIRAPHWSGGGVAFGPKPRSYRTDLPRKVKRQARQAALNARASEGSLFVIEALEFDGPKTRQMAELVDKLGLTDRKVLVLTAETRSEVYLSGRNLPEVRVMRYADAAAYDVLWSDALVVEQAAIGGHAIKGTGRKASAGREVRAKKASGAATRKKAAGRAMAKKRAGKKTTSSRATKQAAKKQSKKGRSEGRGHA